MIKFAHPEYFYLLLVIPVVIFLYWYAIIRKNKYLKNFGDAELVQRLTPHYSRTKHFLKFLSLLLSITFLIIALARPQTGSKLEKIKRSGIDYVIALDVSNSMIAQDVVPNRLENAKQTVIQLLNKTDDDRIALVVFAGKSYVQMPLTNDFSAARLFLSEVNTGMVPTQGTAIGAAIKTSQQCFTNNKHSKAIVIITDGENHEDDAVAEAKNAKEKGIKIITVSVGSAQGAPIPIYSGNNIIGYKKDAYGNTVISKVNDDILKNIAAQADGVLIKASTAHKTAKLIREQLDKMNKNEYGTIIYSDYDEKFQVFLGLSIVFLVLNLIINPKKSEFIGRINPFKKK